jgi:hypothetical protein
MVEYALGQANLCFPLPGAVALLTSLTTVRISTEEQTMKQPDHISHPDHTAVPRCPDEATLFLLMERFIERGYAIVAFTPEELGEADPDAVASHMIEHGWQMIDVENAPKTEERAGQTIMFSKPSAHKIAQKQLDDAQRLLLEHQSAAEYHAHMAAYYTEAIVRLEKFLGPQEPYVAP